MTDIIDRLKECASYYKRTVADVPEWKEAADTIEALRAERLHYVSRIAQKDRVIERLQNELAKRDYGTQQIMRDEIEKRAARAAMGESDE